jgi:hypothetical protein
MKIEKSKFRKLNLENDVIHAVHKVICYINHENAAISGIFGDIGSFGDIGTE